MKNYPLIRRLSTLGIIHHQAFDYEFNSFRTDFVGEGGAGKSLIADLLQLIFVGASAFHSPTKSTGARKPKTMVLKSKSRGSDSGYAFLNIEVSENSYIVIGIYLESGGLSNSFIIQEGTDFGEDSQLLPTNKLLGYEDFLKDDNILPIDYLKDYIHESLGFTCESWQKISKYHAILCNKANAIIPVDISRSSKSLKNYAKIIQAFSRESLDISKSEKIQDFLFGDDKEIEFFQKFKKATEDLSGDIEQYQLNSLEIRKLEEKQSKIQELLQLKEVKTNTEKRYRVYEYRFYMNSIEELNSSINGMLKIYYESRLNLISLKETAEEKREQIKSDLEEVTEQFSEIAKVKSKLEQQVLKAERLQEYRDFFNTTNEGLIRIHEKYRSSKKKIDCIKELTEELKKNNVFDFFGRKDWERNILAKIDKEIGLLEEILIEKSKLKALNNLEREDSLAHWALNLGRILTSNEESIIHKYQNEGLEVSDPLDISKRYIPDPNVLLQNLNYTDLTNDGFWIDLNGIKDFIPIVAENKQIFNTLDTKKIRAYFSNQTDQLDEDIRICELEIENYKTVSMIFNNFDNPREYIDAWAEREKISLNNNHELFGINEGDLKELIEAVPNVSELTTADQVYNKLDNRRLSLNTVQDNLGRDLKQFPKFEEDERVEEYKLKYKFQAAEYSFLEDLGNLEDPSKYYDRFSSKFNQNRNGILQLKKIKEADDERENLVLQVESLKKKYSDYLVEIDGIELESVYSENVLSELGNQNDIALKKYEKAFDRIVSNYVPEKIKRFEEYYDFMDLCEEILPRSIFSEGEIPDEEVITKISKLLTEINIKNKGLNERKIKRLSDIIDEVNAEVSNQINYCRQIRNFLNSDDKIITGKHKATLKDDPNDSFSRTWMEKFVNDVEKDIELGIESDLFKPLKGVSNHLEKYPSLNEKMLEAFYHSGGSRSFTPSIGELLNPKSYYKLKFTIQSASGVKNDGSNSQTYAAIALLCIARLSLINEKKGVHDGVRFIPIDEAAGLGANFDMLYDIAIDNKYQLLSLSIKPNKLDIENQNIYLLHNNLKTEDRVNYDPVPIFGNENFINE